MLIPNEIKGKKDSQNGFKAVIQIAKEVAKEVKPIGIKQEVEDYKKAAEKAKKIIEMKSKNDAEQC